MYNSSQDTFTATTNSVSAMRFTLNNTPPSSSFFKTVDQLHVGFSNASITHTPTLTAPSSTNTLIYTGLTVPVFTQVVSGSSYTVAATSSFNTTSNVVWKIFDNALPSSATDYANQWQSATGVYTAVNRPSTVIRSLPGGQQLTGFGGDWFALQLPYAIFPIRFSIAGDVNVFRVYARSSTLVGSTPAWTLLAQETNPNSASINTLSHFRINYPTCSQASYRTFIVVVNSSRLVMGTNPATSRAIISAFN